MVKNNFCVLVVSHGSREKSANREFKKLVGKYRARHPRLKIGYGFLELAEPSIPRALEALTKSKPSQILVLPLFLFSARHVKKHIPEILKAFQRNHPRIKVKLAAPLGVDSKLLDLLDKRRSQIS